MENITLGQLSAALLFIVAIIAAAQSLKKSIKSWLNAILKERFDIIDKSQAEIIKRLDTVDLENCKNYLVTFLSEVNRGEPKDETEIQRFWEEYEHYIDKGGNSYIRNKVEDLKARKLL